LHDSAPAYWSLVVRKYPSKHIVMALEHLPYSPDLSLGMTVTNQNLIDDEIKSRLNSGNACYHSVQNLLSSRLLLTNVKFRMWKTIILPMVLYGFETWSLIVREEQLTEGV
jgi:hypothetical protein